MRNKHPTMRLSREEEQYLRHWIYDEAQFMEGLGPAKSLRHQQMPPMSTIIGMDLGTTNSLAAYVSGDGPKIIPNALGELLTPSVVGMDLDNKLLVGRAAKELQVTHPERCASLFKRHVGSD